MNMEISENGKKVTFTDADGKDIAGTVKAFSVDMHFCVEQAVPVVVIKCYADRVKLTDVDAQVKFVCPACKREETGDVGFVRHCAGCGQNMMSSTCFYCGADNEEATA